MLVMSLKKGYKLILISLLLNVCNSLILPLHGVKLIKLNSDQIISVAFGVYSLQNMFLCKPELPNFRSPVLIP